MNVAPRWSPATCHSMNGLPYSAQNGSPAPCSTGSPIIHVHLLEMVKATGSPPARRHSGDRLGGKAKKPKYKTKESPSQSFKSTQISRHKHNHKPGLQSPLLSTRLGQYLTAIWHNLSPPLTTSRLNRTASPDGKARALTLAAEALVRLAPGQALAARRRWSGRESHATVVHDHRLYRAPEHAPSKAPRSQPR
jgi:hypothetical protein